jgi:cytochrome c biogenesis protein CcdA
VSDAILNAESDGERIQIAAGMLAYSLGALIALVGVQKASEIAYRHADAAVNLK